MQEPATTDPVETPLSVPAPFPPEMPMRPDPDPHPHPGTRHSARRAFLAAALRSPGMVGAVLPSSGSLAELLAAIVPRTGAPVVVELGPGTGAVTGVIDESHTPTERPPERQREQ